MDTQDLEEEIDVTMSRREAIAVAYLLASTVRCYDKGAEGDLLNLAHETLARYPKGIKEAQYKLWLVFNKPMYELHKRGTER